MTLLLVDDEPNILRALTRMLRRDGYNILTATSGQEGLELVRNNADIKVIISDQRMPEMSGTEFLSQVKAICPSIIRIILSGFSDLATITEAINKGEIFRFLSKPWDDDILRENVKDAFRHYQLYSFNQRELDTLHQHGLSAQKLITLLDELPQAVISLNEQHIVLYSNHIANTLFNDGNSLIGDAISDKTPELSSVLEPTPLTPISIAGKVYQACVSKVVDNDQPQLIITLNPTPQ